MRRRKTQTHMTWKQFVHLYMESWKAGHTTKEFAQRCGLLVSQVHGKVFHLRRKGVELPKLQHSRGGASGSDLDTRELKAIVAGYSTSDRRSPASGRGGAAVIA